MELVDAKEAARIVGVNGSRMRQLALEGKVKAQKFGNAWAFDKEDCIRYRDSDRSVGRPKSK